MDTKRCCACAAEKPVSEFHKNSAHKDGLQTKCKACTAAYQAAYYEKNKAAYAAANASRRETHREHDNAARRAYYAANADAVKAKMAAVYVEKRAEILARVKAYAQANADRIKARSKARYAVNRLRVRAVQLAYYAANAEAMKAKAAKYKKAHPERVRVYGTKNRAKRLGAVGSHTKQDILNLMKLQRGLCVGCRCDIRKSYHVDHIQPLSRGGSNDKTNLQLLCERCNKTKSARHPVEFMQKRGFLL